MEGLALQGGGILGAAQATMLAGIMGGHDKTPASRWTTVAGASVGALNGLVIAMGYSIGEMIEMWLNVKRSDFIRTKWFGFFRESIYSREAMREYIENLIKNKGFDPSMPLSKLYAATGVDLVCTGTVVQTGQPILFGKSFIDVAILDAVFMSTAYPVGFPPVEFDDPRTGKKVQVIDGGVLMNSPILPLVILGCDEIDVLSIGSVNKEVWVNGTYSALRRVLDLFTQGNELASLSWAKEVCNNFRVYHAPCDGIDTFDFDRIKDVLVDGERTASIGPINPSSLIGWVMITGAPAAAFGGRNELEFHTQARARHAETNASTSCWREPGAL